MYLYDSDLDTYLTGTRTDPQFPDDRVHGSSRFSMARSWRRDVRLHCAATYSRSFS